MRRHRQRAHCNSLGAGGSGSSVHGANDDDDDDCVLDMNSSVKSKHAGNPGLLVPRREPMLYGHDVCVYTRMEKNGKSDKVKTRLVVFEPAARGPTLWDTLTLLSMNTQLGLF